MQLLMTHEPLNSPTEVSTPVRVSLGIIVRNEEDAILPMLDSLFRQNLFAELAKRGWTCEILCVANDCTDRTVQIAEEMFSQQLATHPHASAFRARVVSLSRPGKLNAWNQFVHRFSARKTEYLFLMDGDIVLYQPSTLWNMLRALESNPAANVATDEPLKDITFKKWKTMRERLSLATSRMTKSRPAQLTGQLYCIRAAIARSIYLPLDLVACEDGFIKALICTSFLTEPLAPDRIVRANDASHIFQAYTSLPDIIRNQKRQMIGQTIVHLLVDGFLKELPREERLTLADTLQEKERVDPEWLRRLVAQHVQRVRWFWRLFPDALKYPWKRLMGIAGPRKLFHAPSAAAGFVTTVVSCWLAYRFLKNGDTQYWPDTKSPKLQALAQPGAAKRVCELSPQ